MNVRLADAQAVRVRKTGGRLLQAGVATLCCAIFGAVIAFGTTLVVSNAFGEAGAGVFFQVVAYFAIATALATFGADTGLVRAISAATALGRQGMVRRILLIACVPAAAASLLVGGLLYLVMAMNLLPGGPEGGLSHALQLAVPYLPAAALLTAVFGALRGFHASIAFAVLQNLVLPTLRLAGILLVLALGAGLAHLVTAWALPILAAALCAVLVLNREMRLSRTGLPEVRLKPEGMETARGFWGFSGARGTSSMLEVLLEWVDVIAVFILLGPAAGGIYGAINRCVRLGVMLEYTARSVTGPVISSALAVGDMVRARQVFSEATGLLILGAWPFYLLLTIFGPVVLSIFGPGFEGGAPALLVIGPAMLLAVSAGGVQSMLLMGGHSRWQLLNKSVALFVAVLLNVTLIPIWGMVGAATAWAAAVLLDCALATYQVGTLMKIAAPLRLLWLPMALAFAIFGAGGILVMLQWGQSLPGLLIAGGAGGTIYTAAVALLYRRGAIKLRP